MNIIKTFGLAAIAFSIVSSCTDAHMKVLNKTMEDINKAGKPAPLTNAEVISGLKEALSFGIQNASGLANKTDGYFKNSRLFIPFPPEAKNIEDKLRGLGFNKLCDDFTMSVNRGAEQAAIQAIPIFKNAITNMSIGDGFNILKGGDNAATEYLKSNTTPQLVSAFKPIIQTALNNGNATKYWTDIINTYNKIPFITKMNPDLAGYATDKAIQGLFMLVADEEAKIRKDPFARVTDLLKRVFGGV